MEIGLILAFFLVQMYNYQKIVIMRDRVMRRRAYRTLVCKITGNFVQIEGKKVWFNNRSQLSGYFYVRVPFSKGVPLRVLGIVNY